MREARKGASVAVEQGEEQTGGRSGSTKSEKQRVRFATLVDIGHLKNAELEPKLQKYEGRVVFRGDIVKDESGSYAVFTEQRSSASQTTAAKVTDVSATVLDCARQAADAVSA